MKAEIQAQKLKAQKFNSETPSEEYLKMLANQLYDSSDPYITKARLRTRQLVNKFNECGDIKLLEELVPSLAHTRGTRIESPIYVDYGYHLDIGNECEIGSRCVFLDTSPIRLGDRVIIGPGCAFYAATHPVDPELRKLNLEYSKDITLGNEVLIEANVVVCPGVTIGNNCVIKAGSVVAKSLPPETVAAGNPCVICEG